MVTGVPAPVTAHGTDIFTAESQFMLQQTQLDVSGQDMLKFKLSVAKYLDWRNDQSAKIDGLLPISSLLLRL